MNLETIKKSFTEIENLSNDEINELLTDKGVLVGYNRLSRVFPSYFETVKSLVESSKDLKYIDDIYDKDNYHRIGIKFKVNRKPNGVFILKYDDRLYIKYSIEDIEDLKDTAIKNQFVNLITKEYEKQNNTIKPFYGDENISVLKTIIEEEIYYITAKQQPIQIALGDKTLLHSNEFKEYFTDTLIPHLKSISSLIQKKIKEAIELNNSSEKIELSIISKYVQYDSEGEYEVYSENNTHKLEIDKEVLEDWFVEITEEYNEDTDEEYTVNQLMSEEDAIEYFDMGDLYKDIVENIDYKSAIEKFYSEANLRLKGANIYFDSVKFDMEYEDDKKSYSLDFGELKSERSDDDYLYDYYNDYVMWYSDYKFQSYRFH